MPITEVQLSYHKLRALVIAAYDRGESLQDQALTFSHSNIGWDWKKLANILDELVSDCNESDQITIVKSDELDKLTQQTHELGDKVMDTMSEIRMIIGAEANTEIKAKLQALVTEANSIPRLEDYIAELDNFRAGVKAILGSLQMNDDQAIDQIQRLVKTGAIKIQQAKRNKKKK